MIQITTEVDRTSATRSRWLAIVLVTTVLLLAVAIGVGAAPALADDHEPPDVPAAYYGDVTIAGEPAPAGTLVTAVVGGEERGSIVVEEPGQFGGPMVGDEKLEVSGSSGDDSGEPVTFLVNGEEVEPESSVTWESGAHEEVSLDTGGDVAERDYDVSIDEAASTTTIRPGDNATIEAVVENTGDAAGPTDLEFVVDGGPFENAVVDKQAVEVEPGDSEPVAFAIQLDEEGDYDATVDLVHFDSASTTITVDEDADPAPGPGLPPAPPDPGDANIQVTDADLSADRVDVGGAVDISATLENLGGASGLHSVSLTVDGETVASDAVSLDAGQERSLTFTQSFDEAGEYEITVDGVAAGTVTVGSADVSVVDASLDETEVEPGDSVEVTGTVENTGTVAGSVTVELLIDGETVDTQSAGVGPGGSTAVTFTHSFDAEGTYAVALDDANAGTVTVSGPDDGGLLPTPGFTPAITVVALLTVVALGRARVG